MLQSLLLEVSKQVELLHQAARSYYWREIKNKTFRFPPWVWRICPLSLRLCLCRLLHPAAGILNVSKGEILVTKQLKPVPCREDTIVCAAFSLPSQQHQPEPQSKASSPFPPNYDVRCCGRRDAPGRPSWTRPSQRSFPYEAPELRLL